MVKKYAQDYTRGELIATFVSKQITDGEYASAGAGQETIRAGILLAHLTHAPNLHFYASQCRLNLWATANPEFFDLVTDWRGARGAESYVIFDEMPSFLREWTRRRVGFVGAVQIDRYGNTNLIGIGSDYRRLKFRAMGPVGTTTLSSYCEHYYIFAGAHSKRNFVDKCDYVSSYGWGEGGADARTKLGLPGGGPKYCITPLCIMDFEPVSKRMRLKSVHPGVSVNQVVENTGFELVIPANVPETEPPTVKELEVLRTKVDVNGMLRQSRD